jgi:hypothetical protein
MKKSTLSGFTSQPSSQLSLKAQKSSIEEDEEFKIDSDN